MSARPTGTFELYTKVTRPEELRVLSWTLGEELCAGYRAELGVAAAAAGAEELAASLLGQPAALVLHGAREPAVRRGVIARVHVVGPLDRERAELALVVVPLLELMQQKVTSRIFSDKTTPEILAIVTGEWKIAHENRFTRTYEKRAYATQYRETDLEFLTRLCARDGIGFFLEHRPLADGERDAPGEERLVFYDHARAYAAIAPGGELRRPGALVHHAERMTAGEHHVVGFRLERSVLPELLRLGDFDFRKPRLPLRARAALDKSDKSPIGSSLGTQLAVYLHQDRAELEPPGRPGGEIGEALARVRLEQARRHADVGRGASRCLRLAPGTTFTLEEHPGGAATNRAWLVTRVEHRGRIPESDAAEPAAEVYSNAFHCVPADVVYRPAIAATPLRQAVETATVIGPKGAELHCDEHGRVQVEFHWELEGGDGDALRRSWLRVSHPWVGTNWGAQFLPRVGTEVVVGFLDGDPDRPVVLGSVYNGTHPHPFRLPSEAHKSGFRSQSTPGGDGHSELVFDDQKGKEKLSLRAQKDFAQVVENDYELTVRRGESVRVDGGSARTVGAGSVVTVAGARTETVGLDYALAVKGSHVLSVSGNADVRVTGDRVTRVEGREQAELFGVRDATFHADRVERVLGHLVTVVGEHDARRSATLHVEGGAYQYSTGTAELVSDKAIVLRSGKSVLRVGPEGIELDTPRLTLRSDGLEVHGKDEITFFSKKKVRFVAEKMDLVVDKKLVLQAERGKLELDQNARLDGATVKLNCSPEPVDPAEEPEPEPKKLTTVELVDDDGKPLPHRRFVVTLADGSERSGVLDADGKAELLLDDSAEIVFPDVDQAQKS
ncbi:MAG: type VI secretion system tip protein VgrG [Polyangiaceae bacterium]|nr:type VI secretion system tip protein VgrG [Polyangiaceae bacterium]